MWEGWGRQACSIALIKPYILSFERDIDTAKETRLMDYVICFNAQSENA